MASARSKLCKRWKSVGLIAKLAPTRDRAFEIAFTGDVCFSWLDRPGYSQVLPHLFRRSFVDKDLAKQIKRDLGLSGPAPKYRKARIQIEFVSRRERLLDKGRLERRVVAVWLLAEMASAPAAGHFGFLLRHPYRLCSPRELDDRRCLPLVG